MPIFFYSESINKTRTFPTKQAQPYFKTPCLILVNKSNRTSHLFYQHSLIHMRDINKHTATCPYFTTKQRMQAKTGDFILLLQFGFNESTCFSTRFNRFLVEKGPVPRREKQRFSMRKI